MPKPRKSRKRKKATGGSAWISLAIGLGLAVIALVVPLLGFVVGVLMSVIHELGHVATAWIFASPAFPSFDLVYGGGVSHHFARQRVLIFIAYAVFIGLAFRVAESGVRVDYPGSRGALFRRAIFSGAKSVDHGNGPRGRVALRGSVSVPRAQRQPDHPQPGCPLYAFLGLYIVLADARFAYRLITSHQHREEYGLEKGGGHWMDFSLIADEHLHGRLEVVAGLFLVACHSRLRRLFSSTGAAGAGTEGEPVDFSGAVAEAVKIVG